MRLSDDYESLEDGKGPSRRFAIDLSVEVAFFSSKRAFSIHRIHPSIVIADQRRARLPTACRGEILQIYTLCERVMQVLDLVEEKVSSAVAVLELMRRGNERLRGVSTFRYRCILPLVFESG